MAINFPTGATPNQIYTYNGISWKWNGSYWEDYSIFNVGVGFNEIKITGTTQFISSTNQFINFSGIGLTITSASTNTLVFSAGTGAVSSVTADSGLSGNATTGTITIINTDKGSSQNIFKNIQIGSITQFSASSNNANLNFSGVGLSITSGANNTLIFSASPGGVTSIIANASDGISASSSTGAVTLINTRPQGITGITSGAGITATTSNFNVTITNLGVTGITAGYGISANTATGNVTIIQEFDYGKSYTTGNNLNFI